MYEFKSSVNDEGHMSAELWLDGKLATEFPSLDMISVGPDKTMQVILFSVNGRYDGLKKVTITVEQGP